MLFVLLIRKVPLGLKYFSISNFLFSIFWVFIVPVSIFAQEQESIKLLSPNFKNNKPLMQVLQERKSER